jgi:hypothetical protein
MGVDGDEGSDGREGIDGHEGSEVSQATNMMGWQGEEMAWKIKAIGYLLDSLLFFCWVTA